jgi:hypothetical protein
VLEFVTVALAIVWVVVLVQGAVVMELLRQLGQIRSQVPRQGAAILPNEGLPAGAPMPDLSMTRSIAGTSVAGNSADFVLLFLSPECGTCRDIAARIDDLDLEVGIPVVSVVHGDPKMVEGFADDFKIARKRVVADHDGKVAEAFNIKTTPTAVVIRGGINLAHGIVNTADQAAAFYDLTVSRMEVATT